MESGNNTCVIYRNTNFLPSLTDDNRRFLLSPAASSVVSGKPDMVFGVFREKPDGAEDATTGTETKRDGDAPGKPDTANNELETLKADILKNGGLEHGDMYKEPEHSFLRANSEEGLSEINDSASQCVGKLDGVISKENSFVRPPENPNHFKSDLSGETDEEARWTEAVAKHGDLTAVPEFDDPQRSAQDGQGSAHVRLPSGNDDKNNFWEKGRQYRRVPAKLIRLASLSAKHPKEKNDKSQFYCPPRPTPKVISLDDALNSRPPLRVDMEGPTPCTYSPRNKPLSEKNSPSWTFGHKCYIEKTGGARTSWGKMWFQTPHVWHNKVDFNAEGEWPSPTHYPQPSLLGAKQATVVESPSYTISPKKTTTSVKIVADTMPSPVDYSRQTADRQIHQRQPAFTHQFRRDGTILWETTEVTPGPGSYSPRSERSSGLHRSFTISGIRREKSHNLGPFSYL